MNLSIKYDELQWWFWAAILVTIGMGLLGIAVGYAIALAVSIANLAYYIIRDTSLVSFPVQVREAWLVLMLLARLPGMWWLHVRLFIGMIMVVFFDRCMIARVLILMPWNRDVKLSQLLTSAAAMNGGQRPARRWAWSACHGGWVGRCPALPGWEQVGPGSTDTGG